MDRVRDFVEDVKTDRALQLKTFITVVLGITGFALFCVEDARVRRSNEVVHFSKVWDNSQEKHHAKEQLYPVLSVCPALPDAGCQFSKVQCSGYGPDELIQLPVAAEKIKINTIDASSHIYDCFTLNHDQKFEGHNSSYFIRCDLTFAEGTWTNGARITHWANKDVWKHGMNQKPPENTYAWRTIDYGKVTELYLKTMKYDWEGTGHWFSEMHYGQHWVKNMDNATIDNGPHASFTIGYPLGIYEEFKSERIYTTNMMLGTVGGMAFLLSLLNVAAFAIFAGLLQVNDFGMGGASAYGGMPMQGGGKPGAIPASAPAGGAYGTI